MRPSFPKYQKFPRIVSLILLTSYLSGCGDTPVKREPVTVIPDRPPIQAETQGLPPSQFSSQFISAEQQLLEFDWMAATGTLAGIPAELASATDLQYLNYLQARIHYLKGEQQAALQLLEGLERSSTNPVIANKTDNFRRYILSLSDKKLESAELGVRMLQQVNPESDKATALRRSVWRDLQTVSSEELQLALDSTTDPRWRGWLTLSQLTADTGNVDALQRGLAAWHSENPEHPGADMLPGGLEYLSDPAIAFGKVALMLPLSGYLAPAAKAVRDGYLSNFYAAKLAGDRSNELLIMDTNRYDSVLLAYDQAVAQGANLVIGPLGKQAVVALGGHPNRQIPILALNQVEELLPSGNTALVQLALAPEDEAAQIASLAYGRGARRAVVIRPAGSWGVKMEQAVLSRWNNLGGQVAAVASYSSQEDYSSSMASALNLPASEQRARDVRSMLATNIEFTARRRQDIDVIFLLAQNSAEARSLKPLLAYHYAGDLPVYATSSIYRGVPNARNKDLDGMQLVETPWLLGDNPGLRNALAAGGTGSDSYARLNALGADAYLLQSRFRQLQAGPDVQIRGNTGLLSLDPQLRIQRELQAATFDGGTLIAR